MENQNTPPPSSPIQTPVQSPPPVSPSQPTSPGVTPKKKLSLTVIIEAVLFILLAGGAAAGFVYREQVVSMFVKPTPTPAPIVTVTPTPDPTADWKIYTNTKVGYSLKYPQTLLRDSRELCTDEIEPTTLYLYEIDEKLMAEQPNLFCGSDIPLSFRVYVTDKPSIPKTDDYASVTKDNVTISDLSGEKYTSVKKSPQPEGISSPFDKFVSIFLPYKQQTLVIAYGIPSIEESLFDQILSTFKFMDSQTTDTSAWKTYNIGSRVSFKAPATYFVKTGGTTGKDVVLVADKETSITPAGNYLTIDANGLSGYEDYSDYATIATKLENNTKPPEKLQKTADRIFATSTYTENGKQLYGLTGYIKAGTAALFVSFQSEEVSNPHMFDTIISTIEVKN